MRISVRSSDLIAFILRPLEGAVAEALRTMEMQLGSENVEEKAEDVEPAQKPVPRAQGQQERAHVEPVRPLAPAQVPIPKPFASKTDRPVLRLRPRASAPEQPGRRRTSSKSPDPQQPSPTGIPLQANVAKNSLATEPPLAPTVHPQSPPRDMSQQATAARHSVQAGSPIEPSVLPEQRTADSGDDVSFRPAQPRSLDGRERKQTSNGFSVAVDARTSSAFSAAPIGRSAPVRTEAVPVERLASVPAAATAQAPAVQNGRHLGHVESQGARGDASPPDAAPVPQRLRSGPAETGRRRLLVKAIAEPAVPSGIPLPAPPEPSRPKSAATMAMARDVAQPLRPILGDLHKRSIAIKSESGSQAQPRTVLQVNVHIGTNASGPAVPGSSAGRPLDLDALTDALTEALAEAVRREGIEV